jgi:hypothetical protein
MTVAENQPPGTQVGTFATTDPNAGDTFVYALTNGTGSADNGSFTINGNRLLTAASFDYETKNTYSICVRSTDQGGLYCEKAFTITVTYAPVNPIYVNRTNQAPTPNGSIWSPFPNVTQANNAAQPSNTLVIFSANYPESLLINKALTLQATNGVVNIVGQ